MIKKRISGKIIKKINIKTKIKINDIISNRINEKFDKIFKK